MATARPTPNCLNISSDSAPKAENTPNMTTAALVTTPAVDLIPTEIASYRDRLVHPAPATVAGGNALLSPTVTSRVIRQFTRISHPELPRELEELTERELDVFRLVAQGLSNVEIGQELYISDTTVKTHITHILQELNLRDRVQAVVLAYRSGLFDSEAQPS